MLSSGAGPHGSPAHANKTNPSWTRLSVSLFSIPLSPSPSSFFLFFPLFYVFARQCVSLPRLARSLIYFTLCPLISPPLFPLSVPEDGAGALCQLTVARLCSLCAFRRVLLTAPSSLIPVPFSQRWQAAVGRTAACVSP